MNKKFQDQDCNFVDVVLVLGVLLFISVYGLHYHASRAAEQRKKVKDNISAAVSVPVNAETTSSSSTDQNPNAEGFMVPLGIVLFFVVLLAPLFLPTTDKPPTVLDDW